MRKLILNVEWTAAEAATIAEFLGDIAVAIWNEYHDELIQLREAPSVPIDREPVPPPEDDLDLF